MRAGLFLAVCAVLVVLTFAQDPAPPILKRDDGCPPGQGWDRFKSGGAGCTPCRAGTYKDVFGNVECTRCAKGQYQGATGQTVCTDCLPGSYNAGNTGNGQGGTWWAEKCDLCATGRFQAQKGQSTCVNCEKGQYCDVTGMAAPKLCPAGAGSPSAYSRNGWGVSACYNCKAGTFAAVEKTETTRDDVCPACAAGEWSPKQSTKCYKCPEGTFSGAASSFCEQCRYGTFAATKASTQCVQCPAGTYQPNAAASVCSACAAGLTSLPGAGSCTVPTVRFMEISTSPKPTTPKAKLPHVPQVHDPKVPAPPTSERDVVIKPPSDKQADLNTRAALHQEVFTGCKSVASCDECVSSSTHNMMCSTAGTHPHVHYACCAENHGDRVVLAGSHVAKKKGAKVGASVATLPARNKALDDLLISSQAWETDYVAAQFPSQTKAVVADAIKACKASLNSNARAKIMPCLAAKFAPKMSADAMRISMESWEVSYVRRTYFPKSTTAAVKAGLLACKARLNTDMRAPLMECLKAAKL